MKPTTLLACLAMLAFGSLARAQPDQRILFSRGTFETLPISSAIVQLGLSPETTSIIADAEDLLGLLRAQDWDLVIIRWYFAFGRGFEADLAAELEAHVQRGGKIMFSMAKIEQNPLLWDLLGIAGTENLELPLQNIRAPFGGVFDPELRHPAMSSTFGMTVEPDIFGPDYGERFEMLPGGFPIAVYELDRSTAIFVARDGRVVVNGQEWDNWGAGTIDAAKDQIRWLLSCPVDLDGDGDATVFDFLEFQALFDAQSPRADFFYDGRLDVFDFLAFFNAFGIGCP